MPHRDPLLSPQTILWLQTTSGNRAVQRLLARKAMQRAGAQQFLVVSAVPQQLEIVPESSLTVVHEHPAWWWRIMKWFRKGGKVDAKS